MTDFRPPQKPEDYVAVEDPALVELDAFAAGVLKGNDVRWQVQRLREMLPVTPLGMVHGFLAVMGADKVMAESLVPHCEEEARRYGKAFKVVPFDMAQIPEESRLLFSMLFFGDVYTGQHLVNTGFVIPRVFDAMAEQGYELAPDLRDRGVSAAFLHDMGKGQLPDCVLHDPTPRVLQPIVFAANVADERRGSKPVKLPFDLSEEERLYFNPLLSGEDFENPERVSAFYKLCASKRADFRDIPLRFMMEMMQYVMREGRFPSHIVPYVPQDVREDVIFLVSMLRQRAGNYRDMDWVLSRFGLDGWKDTLKTALLKHEAASFYLVPDDYRCVVSRHHGYPVTENTLRHEAHYMPPPDRLVTMGLAMADVITAVTEPRPYHLGGKPKPLPIVKKILVGEGAKMGISETVTSGVAELLLEEGANNQEPLKQVLVNGWERFGA